MNNCRLICLLSRPRTGSSYVLNLLASSSSVESRGEIFHRKRTSGLKRKEINQIFPNRNIKSLDQEVSRLLRRQPRKVLEYLEKACRAQQQHVIFKIFPEHLRFEKLDQVVLLNEGITKVILDRSPIDSFISLVKAGHLAKWERQDTTDIKVELDAGRYMKWYKKNELWYQAIASKLSEHGGRCSMLNYNELLLGDDQYNYRLISDKLVEAGLKFSDVPTAGGTDLFKQDRELAYDNKVTNWDSFREALDPVYLETLSRDGFL